jgi:hypothetical protein
MSRISKGNESFRGTAVPIALAAALMAAAVPVRAAEAAVAATAATVDATTLRNKVLFGYQGWFDCPLSGGGWTHWSRGGTPTETNLTIDAYPDLREFKATDLCAAGDFKIAGKQAYLFSAKTPAVVDQHFKWMQDYGLDGVYVQRFVGETTWKRSSGDQVLKNVMKAAAATGRVWAIEYDVSGASDAGFADLIKKDWQYLVDELKITAAPGYLFEKGKPVVSVWGIGFTDNHPPADPSVAADFINWFKAGAAEKYRAYYMGGTPSWWRQLKDDARTDAAWKPVYKAMDAIQPWAVGRFGDSAGGENWKRTSIIPDLAETKANGNFYVPVAFPGFSWKNLNSGPFNQIPRKGGRFLWRQAMNAKTAGAEALKIAMFDEVDEGTAMFKIASKRTDAPDKGTWLTLDADGMELPSDWYLRVAGEITRVFHGTRPVSDTIPFRPSDPIAVRPGSAPPSRSFSAVAGRDGEIILQGAGLSGSLRVLDPAGKCLRILALENGGARWDRRDASGRRLGPGIYLIQAPGSAALRLALP